MKIRTDFKIIYRVDPSKPVEIKNVIGYSLIGNEFWFMEFERKIKEKNSNSQFGSSEADYVWIPIKDILRMEATNKEIFESHNDRETYVKQILTKK